MLLIFKLVYASLPWKVLEVVSAKLISHRF